nr:RHS repeat-associated core domain-containing protein [Halomonas cerina]
MTKVHAEPGDALVRDPNTGAFVPTPVDPRWVGTGRTVFDNKGNPIKQYEPFFSATSEYEDEAELVESGVTPILRYDPLGRLIRTDNPDGTHVKVEFDAWEQRSFDENDTVFGTPWLAERQAGTAAEQRAATQSLKHQNTPTVAHSDALGRPFLTVADDGARRLETRAELDIEGNTLAITDARGIETLRQTFDVLGRAIFSTSPDAGELRMFPDVANKPARSFTARGHVIRHGYDALQRPTHMFVRELGAGGGETLVQRTAYGEEHAQARDLNLRGEAHLIYDGAGVVKSVEFDFKGNLIESARKLATEYKQAPDWSALNALTNPAAVEAAAGGRLEAETFTSTATFDALDRVTSQTTPDGSITLPTYNEAGLLETLSVRVRGAQGATSFLDNVDYNARGQRIKVKHGNGTVCTYRYDEQTFRLSHQKLQRSSDNQVLQDLAYTYEAAGNIVQITDGVSFTSVQNLGNPGLIRGDGFYEYDGIYQLTKAEGREHPGQQPTHADPMRLRVDHPNDMQALQHYREEYRFDEVGNILEMKHRPRQGPGGWTRHYDYATTSNRLLGTNIPGDAPGQFSGKYTHDAAGNMVTMPHLPLMVWDYANRLQTTAQQVVNSGMPQTTYYTYDATGERVRKVTEHSAPEGQAPRKKQERIYVGSEVFRKYEANGTTVELGRETLHVMDDEHRVVLVETKTVDTSVPAATFQVTSRQRYQVSNHLGSSSMELDGTAQVISYEEYFPFGGTSLHAAHSATEVSAKRYRYTGKERDDETCLYYHGARYYAAWLGRWTSADPAGLVDGTNLFRYSRNNPVGLLDPAGTQAVRGRLVDAAELGLPPVEGLQLPTVRDPEVGVTDLDVRKSRPSTLSTVRGSNRYVDNRLVYVDPRGDQWTLTVDSLVFSYADGSTLEVPWSEINFGSSPRSTSFEQEGGIIFPTDSSGRRTFDAENTPNIVNAAVRVQDQVRLLKAQRLELAWLTYTFAGAVAGLGGVGSTARAPGVAPPSRWSRSSPARQSGGGGQSGPGSPDFKAPRGTGKNPIPAWELVRFETPNNSRYIPAPVRRSIDNFMNSPLIRRELAKWGITSPIRRGSGPGSYQIGHDPGRPYAATPKGTPTKVFGQLWESNNAGAAAAKATKASWKKLGIPVREQ